MSFRTVVISSKSKLNYKNHYLIVKTDSDEKYVNMQEIDTIVVDSICVSISAFLLKEISNYKINVIFCDEKHNPFGELSSFYSSCNTSKKVLLQSKWKIAQKNILWSKIVANKISNQAFLLKKINSDSYDILIDYIKNIKDGDKTNREAHAAKVYFNSLFTKSFTRNTDNNINAALNYGYSILLSTFNKEVVSLGYVTQLGIFHKNEFNQFNLSSDLMEPFRVIIDNFVYYNKKRDFDSKYKLDLINLFNNKYEFCNKLYTLKDIIKLYTKSTLDYFESNNYKEFIYNER